MQRFIGLVSAFLTTLRCFSCRWSPFCRLSVCFQSVSHWRLNELVHERQWSTIALLIMHWFLRKTPCSYSLMPSVCPVSPMYSFCKVTMEWSKCRFCFIYIGLLCTILLNLLLIVSVLLDINLILCLKHNLHSTSIRLRLYYTVTVCHCSGHSVSKSLISEIC